MRKSKNPFIQEEARRAERLRQEHFLDIRLDCASDTEAAGFIGVSLAVVHKWMEQQDFERRYASLMAEGPKRAIGNARMLAPRAVQVMLDAMDATKPISVRHTDDGEREWVDVPDHGIRLKAAEMIARISGLQIDAGRVDAEDKTLAFLKALAEAGRHGGQWRVDSGQTTDHRPLLTAPSPMAELGPDLVDVVPHRVGSNGRPDAALSRDSDR